MYFFYLIWGWKFVLSWCIWDLVISSIPYTYSTVYCCRELYIWEQSMTRLCAALSACGCLAGPDRSLLWLPWLSQKTGSCFSVQGWSHVCHPPWSLELYIIDLCEILSLSLCHTEYACLHTGCIKMADVSRAGCCALQCQQWSGLGCACACVWVWRRRQSCRGKAVVVIANINK